MKTICFYYKKHTKKTPLPPFFTPIIHTKKCISLNLKYKYQLLPLLFQNFFYICFKKAKKVPHCSYKLMGLLIFSCKM